MSAERQGMINFVTAYIKVLTDQAAQNSPITSSNVVKEINKNAEEPIKATTARSYANIVKNALTKLNLITKSKREDDGRLIELSLIPILDSPEKAAEIITLVLKEVRKLSKKRGGRKINDERTVEDKIHETIDGRSIDNSEFMWGTDEKGTIHVRSASMHKVASISIPLGSKATLFMKDGTYMVIGSAQE
ncbi:hypothetical protein LCGC14_2274490 [marine sediment metagenome]|uniref:Uncharacterized protein n=1 Tax=marine sediment metagenome TaxID=412755 RepID=A0A0F9CW65_9ZZZZ